MAIDIHSLGRDHLDSAFHLATRVFADASTLHRALRIGLEEYRDHLREPFEQMLDEGLSVAATDSVTQKLVGCLIATDICYQSAGSTNSKPEFLPLAALTAELARQYRRQRSIAAGDAVLVDMGAVSADAGGHGVYQLMRSALHDIARDRGFRWVVGELSSAATQHVVLNRLGHRNRAEIAFNEFQYRGERPFLSINDPPSIILSEGDL